MNLDELVSELRSALPASLSSVVLFGSAVTGDFTQGRSHYDLLIVSDRLGPAELQALTPALTAWTRDQNPTPLLFTREQLLASADAFPIEYYDIRQTRRVLYGEDPFPALSVDQEHLRRQLERELKGKLLALRGRYALIHRDSRQLRTLIADSASTFMVLCRASLRLYQEQVPAPKLEALRELAVHIPFQVKPFEIAHAWKSHQKLDEVPDVHAVFAEYLRNLEVIVDAVDRHIHRPVQEDLT